MQNELLKTGHFTTEITFEVDIEYEFMFIEGEVLPADIKAKMENWRNEIDIFPYLPEKVLNEIDDKITEDIADGKKDGRWA